MPWYIYSVTAALCFAGMMLCTRHLGNKGFSTKQILTFLLGFAFLGFLLLNFGALSSTAHLESFSLLFLVIMMIGALFSIIGNLALFTAVIKAPNPGFVGFIQSSNILLITLLSVLFFGSHLSWLKFLGAVIVMIGVTLLVVDRKKTAHPADGIAADSGFLNWKVLAIVAAVAFSVLVLVQKQALQLGFSSSQINLFIFGLNFATFLFLSRRELRSWFADTIRIKTLVAFTLLAGTFSLLANYVSVIGIGLAPNPGYSESIKYTKDVFITLLAVPLFHTSIDRRKTLGVIAMLVGTVLIGA